MIVPARNGGHDFFFKGEKNYETVQTSVGKLHWSL